MGLIQLDIDFRVIKLHSELVSQIHPVFEATPEDEVYFNINLDGESFLFSDFLLLLVGAAKYLKDKNIVLKGVIEDFSIKKPRISYASRVNFFSHLGLNLDEGFTRRNPSGRFTEICRFDQNNVDSLFRSIMRILMINGVNEDMLVVLNFCLYEVLDNTLNHSSESFRYGEGSGFACAQFFPSSREVRIIISDNGQGIHRALTTHPDSKFKNLSEGEAVLRSVEKGVTNSRGMGFGLWATAEMMKKNKGDLIIHSGEFQLNDFKVIRVPNWQGTYTFLRINTDIPVHHQDIFGEKSDQLDMFQEFKSGIFGDLEDLW